ncbi:MAG: transcription termination factor Rho [Clostridiales bacterium]|nr:transcription termination factor Rho [Clostridiales bacterium]
MDKLELALMLDNEQRKANEAEDSKNKAEAAAVNPPPKEKTKRAASKKKTEKTTLEMMGDSMPETETISVVEEEKPTTEKASAKRGRKPKNQAEEKKEIPSEEASAESTEKEEKTAEVKPENVSSDKKEEKTSDSKTSKRKKKTAKEEKASEEVKPESSDSENPQAAEEKKEEPEASSETKEKTDKKSRGRKKKNTKEAELEEVSSEEKKEETPSEPEVKEESKPAEKQETPSNGNNGQQQQNGKNKKQKGRHRSVEIRPAGETESSTSEGSSEEKNSQDGENTQENTKPQIEPIEFVGVLEIVQEGGYGFVRRENYLPSPQDVFVPTNLIRRFGLRIGDQIRGFALPKRGQEKNLALHYITTVNDVEVDKLGRRPHFERLTPIYPDERFRLETGKQELSTRIIDLVSPIGKGQRGMIVSPPKAGKTILLQKIANAITANSPKTKLIVLLIDERPEEVTDMQRSIKGEVVYSTFDKKPENHTRVTELVLERAMRLVEMGEDVVILLDSMTRLARAYNLTITPTGRTLSGGLDPGSLYGPKRFFGAARNIENGGSLTIVATSLIETGSRMDEVIFEEFKGTGNMEVYLDRKLSEKRIFPAIDINKSGTRREDLLMSQEELDAVWTIRKAFSQMEIATVTETIIGLLLKTNSNDQFVRSVKVSFTDKEVFDAMRGTGANGSANGN